MIVRRFCVSLLFLVSVCVCVRHFSHGLYLLLSTVFVIHPKMCTGIWVGALNTVNLLYSSKLYIFLLVCVVLPFVCLHQLDVSLHGFVVLCMGEASISQRLPVATHFSSPSFFLLITSSSVIAGLVVSLGVPRRKFVRVDRSRELHCYSIWELFCSFLNCNNELEDAIHIRKSFLMSCESGVYEKYEREFVS